MKKRTILKKFSGSKKDKSMYYAIVLGSAFISGTLYTEKVVFVSNEVYDAVEEGQTINVQ